MFDKRFRTKIERSWRVMAGVFDSFTYPLLLVCLFSLYLWDFSHKNPAGVVGPKYDVSSQVPEPSNSLVDFYWHNEKPFIFLLLIKLALVLIWMALVCIAGWADDEKDRNPSLNLISSDNSLKQLIELIFLKHQVFKNSHRNWPEVQALCGVIVLGIMAIVSLEIYWLAVFKIWGEHIPIDSFLLKSVHVFGSKYKVASTLPASLLTIYFGIYVYIKKDYADKWKYCADSYYKISASTPGSSLSSRCSLAIDVLYLDLWAKRGFCKFFSDTLNEVIDMRRDWSFEQKETIRKKIRDHLLASQEAEEILEHGLMIKDVGTYMQLSFSTQL